jgi:uncharacterized protein (DUF1800 family)
MMPLDTDRQRVSHLLRRFGLGAGKNEVDALSAGGWRAAVDLLFDAQGVDEGFSTNIEQFQNPQNGQIPVQALPAWWVLRMVQTRRPLQEKVTLFWHDHFATSAEKVRGPLLMHQQNETLRKHGLGRFEILLTEVAKDPAMLIWLDSQFNVSGKPNENFARELMELFSLGVGHYSEEDVLEVARAFTGWSVRRANRQQIEAGRPAAEFQFRAPLHDRGQKTVLGATGPWGGEDVISLLCNTPRTSEYLTKKIWEWFVYPDPDPATVSKFARTFRDSRLHIGVLLKEIARSPEFYSAKAERALIKSPVDFCVSTLRQVGAAELLTRLANQPSGNFRARIQPVNAASQSLRNMGMWLFYPPDVSGWDGGEAWISTATMVERMKWADRLFSGPMGRGAGSPLMVALSNNPAPRGVASTLVSIFDAPIPDEKMPALVAAARKASGGRLTPQNAVATASAVSRLIFASPEFQFC